MDIVIIDGQGGGFGRALIEALRAGGVTQEIVAVGTNALATSAVAESPAHKVLIPVAKCGAHIAGLPEKPLAQYIADAAELIRGLL